MPVLDAVTGLGAGSDVLDRVADALSPVLGPVLAALRDVLAGGPGVLVPVLAALVAVMWSACWRLTRIVVTIAHEGGHALAAVLAGRGLTGIRLHPDTSGLTVSTGAPRGPGLVVTFLGGYPAPSMLGLAGAGLVAADRPEVLLWLVTALLAATLWHVRNVYGVLVVLLVGAVVGMVALRGASDVQAGFATGLTWFLLLGGLRAVGELRRGRRGDSDADALARLTGVPGGIWVAVFWLVGAVAAAVAVWLTMFR